MDNKNHYFSDSYKYAGSSKTNVSIRLTRYDKDSIESTDIDLHTKSFKALVDEKKINWFRVEGLKDAETINRMVKDFAFHNLDARNILTPDHVVKIDNNEDYLFIVLNNCTFNAQYQIYSEHICIIVCNNIVISFAESDESIFKNVDEGLKSDVMRIREQKSGMLLAFLLNSIFADMIETSSKIEKILEKIEGVLLENHYRQGNVGPKIQQCRRTYLIIRKNTHPLKDEFFKLMKVKPGVIDKALLPVFNDLSDQLEYIIQTSENSKDILTSLVDLYVSNNDLRTNKIMKRLTVVSTLFIPVTFLVGVWGMNFEIMPELGWVHGYLFAWIVIFLCGVGTWWFMKKKKWF